MNDHAPDPPVDPHCLEIERCNQRGGRMLSIVDLLGAGTVTLPLAAYLFAAIRNSASFMVGANPGGAGKTTVMGALLNFVPDDTVLRPADSIASIEEGFEPDAGRCCYICHEISPGHYYAYLWAEALRAFFSLPDAGHMLATNLHADTFTEAEAQVCGDNGVPAEHFRRMNLILFLRVAWDRTRQRTVTSVWESDGIRPHTEVYRPGAHEAPVERSALVTPDQAARAKAVLQSILESGAVTLHDVRHQILVTQGETAP